MTLREVSSAAEWESLLGQEPSPSVLQSWAWGEVQSRWGWSPWRLAGEGFAASLLERNGRGLRLAYVPRGPVAGVSALPGAARSLLDWTRSRGQWVLRLEPNLEEAWAGPGQGWVPGPGVQPEATVIVPVSAVQDSMLAAMHSKTRYNLRLAERRGVATEVTSDAAALAPLTGETAHRQGIALPPRAFYEDVLRSFGDDACVVTANGQGQTLAALLVVAYRGRGYYLYGGSSDAHRELMASHLAQWQAMRWCASRGCTDYDLWGIAPTDDPGHAWHGLRRFKLGFGGREVHYPGAWDARIRPLPYMLSHALERAGKRIRRFIIR